MSKRKKRKEKKLDDEHGTKDVDEQLDELFEETWDGIEPRSFEEVPDATYQSRLLAARINNAKSSGRLQCSWEWLIVEGEYRGRHIYIHQGLGTEDGVAYFKGSLTRLGYEEPESKEKLIEILEEIVEGPTYAVIRLSTRKRKVEGELQEIQNKRIIKALDSDEVEDDFEESELAPTLADSPPSEESSDWEKGDRIKTEIDGESYEGKIKSIKETTAVVTFDDGDEFPVSLDQLEEVEVEKEKEGKKEPSCELSNKKFTPTDRRTTKKLAKKHDFNPDDFDNSADLLCEIGDYWGMSGKFKSPAVLIKAIQGNED